MINGVNPSLKHAFPKEERLRKKKEFTALFKEGRVYTGRDLQLFVLPRPDGLRKAGFVFSRRIKSSVQRNRLRRLLRQAYRQNKERFFEGYSLLVRVNRPLKRVSFSLVEAEFLDLTRQAEILRRQIVSRETIYPGTDERRETIDERRETIDEKQ